MFTKAISVAAAALAASTVVSAQTSTLCNPMKKDCPPDKAFCAKVTCDLTKDDCNAFTAADGTTIAHNDKGAVFTIKAETDAPTITSEKYIFFGRVDVVAQAAAGKGIVTSVVLQSDDLDEIDWEWIGSDNAQVQTNYFSKGDTTTYDRGAFHPVQNPVTEFHTYSLEWTRTYVKWSIDNVVVRTLNYADAKGGAAFPQTPMQVKLGTWVAGRSDAPEGTVEWAGGLADFSNGPSLGYYKSITIVDYAGTDAPCAGGVSKYVYGDRSGTYDSIKVIGGSDDATNNTTNNNANDKTNNKTNNKTNDNTNDKTTNDNTSDSTSATSSETATSEASSTESAHSTKTPQTTSKGTNATSMATSVSSTGSASGASATGGSGSSSTPSVVPTAGAQRVAAASTILMVGAGLLAALLL